METINSSSSVSVMTAESSSFQQQTTTQQQQQEQVVPLLNGQHPAPQPFSAMDPLEIYKQTVSRLFLSISKSILYSLLHLEKVHVVSVSPPSSCCYHLWRSSLVPLCAVCRLSFWFSLLIM